jgi:hypothetical protein
VDSTHPSPTDIRAAGTFSARRRPCLSNHDLSPPPRSAKKNSGVARRPLKLRFEYHWICMQAGHGKRDASLPRPILLDPRIHVRYQPHKRKSQI